MLRLLRQTVVVLVLLSVLTGLLYPLAVTGIAQLAFPRRANGSLIVRDGRVVGSEFLGQPFREAKYFWPRPSATSPIPYDAGNSTGSNLGPLNPALAEKVRRQAQALRSADPAGRPGVPVDLVTASGSGLDPHISLAGALYQAPRVARARGLEEEKVRALVLRQVEERQLGLLGERRFNVLRLNLALDGLE